MSSLSRTGIIDLGSNAVRLVVAEGQGEQLVVLERHRCPVRLGQDVFDTGEVRDDIIAALVDAFGELREICSRLAVTQIRAIATSAMRDATNREAVISRVRAATGIEIEVISGLQEAGLLTRAVQDRVDLSRGASVLLDVGGGSVEVVRVDDGEVTSSESYAIGSLRLLALLDDSHVGDAAIDLLRRHLKGVEPRLQQQLGDGRIDRYIAVGGSIESLAGLVAAPNQQPEAVESVVLEAVRAQVTGLAALSVADRMAQTGLTHDRADTIVPAGVLYLVIGELAKVDRVYVPRVGIKEGLLAGVCAGEL